MDKWLSCFLSFIFAQLHLAWADKPFKKDGIDVLKITSPNEEICYINNQLPFFGDIFLLPAPLLSQNSQLIHQTPDPSRFEKWIKQGSIDHKELVFWFREIGKIQEISFKAVQLEVSEKIKLIFCNSLSWVYLANILNRFIHSECERCNLDIEASRLVIKKFKFMERPWECKKLSSELLGCYGLSGTFVGKVDLASIMVTVEAYQVKESIPVGEFVSPSQLVRSRVTLPYRDVSEAYVEVDDLKKYILNREIKEGEILLRKHLRKHEMVKAFKKMRALLRDKEIEIETIVTPQKSGVLGDIIPVLIDKTQKILSAKILGERELEIID